MAQWAKCLLYKYEDLDSDLQHAPVVTLVLGEPKQADLEGFLARQSS